MDIFVEQLIKKKRTGKDFLMVLLCIAAVFVVMYVMAVGMMFPGLNMLIFAVCVILLYLLYLLVTSINLEYEYCFTNGILDVDKIVNVRRRKALLELNVRKMDMMGTRNHRSYRSHLEDRSVKKLYACTHREAEDLCFILYTDEEGRKKMLLFNPNEEIREGIRRYNPQKVDLNDESRN